jgi:hypothetical protein
MAIAGKLCPKLQAAEMVGSEPVIPDRLTARSVSPAGSRMDRGRPAPRMPGRDVAGGAPGSLG